MEFPENFTWGAAASAYQIEGACREDGRGRSVWDMFTGQPGRIWEGGTGDITCDHYHRYKEDIALMAQIGLRAYRLSISWTRVMPNGVPPVNPYGLDFYDRLVDELLVSGIEPWVTLFHWDYPYELFIRGGWINPDSPRWFAKYTEEVVKRLSDRVSNWLTLNEPQCFIGMGHLSGEHAPGLKLDLPEVLLAGHHALLAHGHAVRVIREHAHSKPNIGWSPAGLVYCPAAEIPADIEAAKRMTFSVFPDRVWNNRWWADPVVFGHYPEEGLRAYYRSIPRFSDNDLKTISEPIDFYGCNIFQAEHIKADPEGNPITVAWPPGQPQTSYLWRRTPTALYWGPRFLAEFYKLPVVVTENGMSTFDTVSCDGRVHDRQRIEFLGGYLIQLRRAVHESVDVRGYFCWSIMDNFEWHEGFKHRFGLIHVDYETQRRTLKESAYWFREIIGSNGRELDKFLPESATPLPYVVKETIQYIGAHIAEAFNIRDLAAHLRCHPDYLGRKFKQHMGVELSHYIRRTRIERARELLRDAKILVEDVAERCGFPDRVQFTKVFRRLTGETPGQFQRQFRTSAFAKRVAGRNAGIITTDGNPTPQNY